MESFSGDAFGSGDYLNFEEGGAYALPSSFVQANSDKLEPVFKKETKPARPAIEVKSDNRTSKRANKSRRAKAKPQDN